MSDNKAKREELERIYGAGSMFQKARTEEYIATLPRIKGIKQYIREKHYSGKVLKQLRKQMQYHHMKHKSEGGKATLENGAVVDAVEHPYMHSLPREYEEIINNHIRKWKVDFLTFTTDKVIDSAEVCRDDEEFVEIPVYEYHKFSKKQLRRMRRRQEKRELREKLKELEDR